MRTRAGTKTTLVRTDKIPSLSHWQRLARQAEFNPAKMASLCGVSERQLQRIFKKHLGASPSKWLRALQCRLAEELVIQGYSNKAVAAALKFSTDAHFCREFKKIFGVPPQRFASARASDARQLDLGKVDVGPAADNAR
jgi:AraC-like DNA-binding protein